MTAPTSPDGAHHGRSGHAPPLGGDTDWHASDPWQHAAGGVASYLPDYALLGDLLGIPVSQEGGLVSEDGVFPKGIDVWLSCELRRAGFSDAETWPRLAQPRVLPRDVDLLIKSLPTRMRGHKGFNLREEVLRRVRDLAAITPADA